MNIERRSVNREAPLSMTSLSKAQPWLTAAAMAGDSQNIAVSLVPSFSALTKLSRQKYLLASNLQ